VVHEQDGGADLGGAQLRERAREQAVLQVEEQVQGDVGGAGLGEGEEGVEG
jgi:hypothetical protein